MATRRGFLQNLFKGGVVGAAAIAVPVSTAAPVAQAEESPDFVFLCMCRRQLRVATVYKIGEIVRVECENCNHEWKLRCHGSFFAMEGYENKRLPDWITKPIEHEHFERKIYAQFKKEDV